MSKYYDLDKLKKLIEAKAETLIGDGAIAFHAVGKWLDLLPAEDVAPIVHAHFVKNKNLHTAFCSVCTFSIRNHTEGIESVIHYCPNCGAKMDEEVKP